MAFLICMFVGSSIKSLPAEVLLSLITLLIVNILADQLIHYLDGKKTQRESLTILHCDFFLLH